jgi:hypothetical protein
MQQLKRSVRRMVSVSIGCGSRGYSASTRCGGFSGSLVLAYHALAAHGVAQLRAVHPRRRPRICLLPQGALDAQQDTDE